MHKTIIIYFVTYKNYVVYLNYHYIGFNLAFINAIFSITTFNLALLSQILFCTSKKKKKINVQG